MLFNCDGFAKKFHLSNMGKKEWSLEKSPKKFYVNTCLLMKYLLPKWQGNVHIFGTTIDVLGVNFLVNFWNNGWQ